MIRILRLDPDDWPSYRRLRIEALRTDPQAFGSTLESTLRRPDDWWRQRLVDAAAGKDQWLFFAKKGEDLLGMVGAVSEEPKVAEVISMYVTPLVRRQGVARLLLRTQMEALTKAEIRTVRLQVRPSQIAARTFYSSEGFVPVAMSDGEIVMEKQIS